MYHWELTEQLFNETLVFTTRRVSETRVKAQGTVRFAPPEAEPSLRTEGVVARRCQGIYLGPRADAGRYDHRARGGRWHRPCS